ncbi:STE family protein kinase [Histomonas meleagridis]|uniref:STE family protein kinase n=1 Tax=Histomonas meleagridis TaxID=135588 RepID=UPI0035594093|nr:STE family protein kinase [Histomonas meleagridis]KAH0805062.1 STE family protein kinase [Histomonas meleagridis]
MHKKQKKKSSSKKISISSPLEVSHVLHIDQDLNWSFDSSVPPESIFTKIRNIGKGGFGDVIQLLHIPSQTLLAGKSINDELISPKTREALKREIDLMREIVSPYTIHYYGSIIFNKKMTILMEFCPQGSLRDLIDISEKVLSEAQISFVMHDLLCALQVLHNQHHIVHRDIKAANILLSSNGYCRVTDFGVSRKFASDKSFSTTTMVGTPYWMAPEVINEEKYSFPADIWSTAATAMELAEGAPPFCEFPPTRAIVEIATKGFPGLRFPKQFSQSFVHFIEICAQVDPSKRPTVEQLLKHPFVARTEKMNRTETMASLLNTQMCFEKLLEMDENEEMDTESFQSMTRSFIRTSKKTLRK